jgi:hypothetical protein
MATLNKNIRTLIENMSNEIHQIQTGGDPYPYPQQVITLRQYHCRELNHNENYGHYVTSAEWMEHFQNECINVFVIRNGQVYSVTSDVFPAENWTIDEYANTYMMVDLDEKVWGINQ